MLWLKPSVIEYWQFTELAHYPDAHEPDPNEIPRIERDDFPAPPYTQCKFSRLHLFIHVDALVAKIPDYPYHIEEMKRRLSSSSVENDSSDEEDYGDQAKVDEDKIKRNVQALNKFDKEFSIAHILKQNIEDSKNKQRLPLHWDPRNASRTPSAKKMPHLRFRYDTPINACKLMISSVKSFLLCLAPSRHLSRPKPWAFWSDGQNKSATTALPSFHVPGGTFGDRAATLPDGYYMVCVSFRPKSTHQYHLALRNGWNAKLPLL